MYKEYGEGDLGLVEACIKRDLVAWSILVKKYSRLIYLSIEKRLRKYGLSLPAQDIEDIRQNVVSRLWEDGKLEDVKNRNNITYWLSIVSGNMALEYARKLRSSEPLNIPLTEELDEAKLMSIIPARSSGPIDACDGAEIRKRIKNAIASLPAREKLIIKLNMFHEKKYHEIARMLDLPAGTVSSYIRRAKEKMRKNLKDLQQF